MTLLLLIAAACVAVAIALYLVKRKNAFEKRVDLALSAGLARWSPRNVDVARERGTQPLTDEQLETIDQALTIVYERARARGYRRYLDHSVYTVVILKSEMYKGLPVFRMHTGEYVTGAGYDMDEHIIAVAECTPEQNSYLAQSVINEAEHVIAFHNDRELFEDTKVHEDGEGHPLF